MTPKLIHPFAKPAKAGFRELVRADGVRVWDRDGNEYIDGMASLWYCQVGYGRAEIVDAVSAQLHTMAAYNVFDPWGNEPAESVARRIADLSPLDDARVFLCCSGSEAVDSAFKIARLVPQLAGDTDRQILVRRTRGYHGVNAAGTSLQGLAPIREGWGDLVPHVVEIDPDDIESAASLFAEKGDQIAGVICEPVQGAGGVYPPTDQYLRHLRELCTKSGSLLIFDEVISGFGRTGEWFASQTYSVEPDLITFAKGVTSGYQPLGGVIVSRQVCDALEADSDFVFRHGYTYSGHPAAAAAALANIDIIEHEGLCARATHIGERFYEGLAALAADGDLAEVRGVGGMWAGELPEGADDSDAVAVRDRMLDLGVICRPVAESLIFCPPLIIEDTDIDRCVDALAQAVRDR